MITGRVFEIDDMKSVPLWDSPVMVAPRASVVLVSDKDGVK